MDIAKKGKEVSKVLLQPEISFYKKAFTLVPKAGNHKALPAHESVKWNVFSWLFLEGEAG